MTAMRAILTAFSLFLATVVCKPSYFDYSKILQNLADEEQEPGFSRLQADVAWTQRSPELGQISGVDVDAWDNPVLIHRSDRVWSGYSFDKDGKFMETSKGKIAEAVIVTLNRNYGTVVHERGANRFYLPHGLTIDEQNNVWVTDVALHQVFKFVPDSEEPVLTLGEALEPGNDTTHFCKPTDVAVAKNGQFFVSDGYCNNRIMKFNADGTFIKEWGHAQTDGATGNLNLNIPHSLALAEEEDIVCVADRENERIQCYHAGLRNESDTGKYWGTITNEEFGRVFALTYDKQNALMHVVNGQSTKKDVTVKGITFDTNTGDIIEEWAPPQGFQQPHDVAVSHRGSEVYVADIGYNRVWKFVRSFLNSYY